MVGLVHNLCEPGFFGDSKFVGLIAGSFQRWVVGYLRDFSCFLLVGSLLFSGQLVTFSWFHFQVSLVPLPSFAAWVAFVGLCGRERSECSRF